MGTLGLTGVSFCFLLLAASTQRCHSDAEVTLVYRVGIGHGEGSTLAISAEVRGISDKHMVLRGFEPNVLINVTDLRVQTLQGEELAYRVVPAGGELVGTRYVPMEHYEVETQGHETIQVSYRVRPGAPIGKGHGLYPKYVSGYVGEDFGLLSGRNLFLVPDSPIGTIEVRLETPPQWRVATTWRQEAAVDAVVCRPRVYGNKSPEDLVNGSIGLGALVLDERQINGTLVRVYSYAGWPEDYRHLLTRTSFGLYEYMSQLFGATDQTPYTLIFTPRTRDGLNIKVASTGDGLGQEMVPANEYRWIAVAEEMAHRWLRYQPHRMEFDRSEDMWFVDGAAIYLALKAGAAVGVVKDIDAYWSEYYRLFNTRRIGSYQKTHFTPAAYYLHPRHDMPSRLISREKRQTGMVLVHALDCLINLQSRSQYDIGSVLRKGYSRGHNLHLRELIQETTQVDVGPFFREYVDTDALAAKPLHFSADVLDDPTDLPRLPLDSEGGSGSIQDTLTLVVSGRVNGFLEACGCKVNQSGGVTRRMTLVKQIRQLRRHVTLLEAGNSFPGESKVPYMDTLAAAEVSFYLAALHRMGYGLIGIGDTEIYYGADFLRRQVDSSAVPLVSANVLHNGKLVGRPTYSVMAGPYSIGFVGVLQDPKNLGYTLFQDSKVDFGILDPLEVVGEYLQKLKGQNDFVGIIGRLDTELVLKLVRRYPDLDLVITIGHDLQMMDRMMGNDGRVVRVADEMYGFLGNTLVIYANFGVYGMHHVDISIDSNKRFSQVEISPLEVYHQIEEDPDMKAFVEAFYGQVAQQEEMVNDKPQPLFVEDGRLEGRQYVGKDTCTTCHVEQHTQWATSRHAQAYSSLLNAQRHYLPKCVVCHVAGLGRPTGFDILHPDRQLANVQCEVCHGPGGNHVDQPLMRFMGLKQCQLCHGMNLPHVLAMFGETTRRQMVGVFHNPGNSDAHLPLEETLYRKPPEKVCLACHTAEHDDDFVYERDYQLVRH
jgi:hypothetical protein